MQFYTRLKSLYEFELNLNGNIQNQFSFAEPLFRNLNEYLDTILVINLWIPVICSCKHKLLVQAVTTVGLTNTLASVIKWCLPEHRPNWWLKESEDSYETNDIIYDSKSCDTSAGFPSSHVMTLTAFTFILVWRFIKFVSAKVTYISIDNDLLANAIVLVVTTLVWISRLYFFHEFLHQCIAGSMLAIGLLYILKRFSSFLFNVNKLKAFLLVICFGLVPISSYFVMLLMDVDPFWSVRMAFKWCADTSYLKHETTPVFTLCRDFGYLLGIALSCPLAQSYANTADNYRKRLPIVILVETFNYISNSYTPKQHGRFIFVAYEFLRNCLHTFFLLTILPTLDKK